jgi:hypothetical protein
MYLELESMINVLERKGIRTGKEVLDEMEVIVTANGERWECFWGMVTQEIEPK